MADEREKRKQKTLEIFSEMTDKQREEFITGLPSIVDNAEKAVDYFKQIREILR